VTLIEKSIVNFLSRRDIKANAKIEAPGVYIGNKKIASLGLRIKNHASYHGLSLNIDMDLSPFEAIDPCGYKNLQMTQLKTFINDVSIENIGLEIANDIKHQLLNLKS
jgi:lipoyl(octanoyl) transferase